MVKRNDDRLLREAKIYKVSRAKDLLGDITYQRAMDTIQQLTLQSEEGLECYYVDLVRTYADFVQQLPHPDRDTNDTMLRTGLRRALLMLRAFRDAQCSAHSEDYLKTDDASRTLYAVFSAALLFEIGTICIDRKIVMCDEKGVYHHDWDYFSGPMHSGSFFKIRYGSHLAGNLVPEVTYILAKQLMPSKGFFWLSQDNILLKTWFISLTIRDEFFSVGKIDIDLEAFLKSEALQLAAIEEEAILDRDHSNAEAFWAWIQAQIEDDPQKINREGSGIYYIHDEMAFDYSLLKGEFAKQYPQFADGMMLDTHLGDIGVVPLSGQDMRYKKFYAKKSGMRGFFSTDAAVDSKQLVVLDKHRTRFYIPDTSKIAAANLTGGERAKTVTAASTRQTKPTASR